MNYCIFRTINDCKCCSFKTKNKYCYLHTNNANIIYEIVNEALGSKQLKTVNDIYLIFKYIYNNPNIYVKEFIFKKILNTLFIKQWTLRNKFYYFTKKLLFSYNNYNSLIDMIFKINLNTYNLEKTNFNNNINCLPTITKFLKYVSIKQHIYNSNLKYTNETDPFTLELIDNIPIKERFIFNEDSNYYCFKANEFKYFMRTNGNWNPYTKKTISCNILKNLDTFIDYFKLDKIKNIEWKTLEQAYTDVSIAIEKIGFYTNTQWFLKLTGKQIRNVIRLYKVICSRITNEYFNDIIIINHENEDDNNINYYFAKEIIKIFNNGNSNFLLCCNFMKALGVYSNDFYNSLPEWLSDIDSPIIINNYVSRDLVYLINIIES